MERVIEQARHIRTKYCELCRMRIPLAINTGKLAKVVSQESGYSIEAMFVPDMGQLRGMLVRRTKSDALVLISERDTTECWKRFTFAKEISHLFLDIADDGFCTDAFSLASSLVDLDPQHDGYISELSGVVAALEIMLPAEMESAVAHMANVKGNTPYVIASSFKIPQKFVEYRLRQWGLPIN